jgi:hypothetical protein
MGLETRAQEIIDGHKERNRSTVRGPAVGEAAVGVAAVGVAADGETADGEAAVGVAAVGETAVGRAEATSRNNAPPSGP